MKSLILPALLATAASLATAPAALAELSVKLAGGWDGKRVPAGQHCPLFGGKGATPPMQVSGLPQGTAWVYVEFNDRSYKPLSRDGGHGVIGYPVKGASANLHSVPGLAGKLPGQAKVIKPARGTGKYKSSGYLPPCSGGKGNAYFAVVKAISAKGQVLDRGQVELGRY